MHSNLVPTCTYIQNMLPDTKGNVSSYTARGSRNNSAPKLR